jgi:hypothetical protein
LKYDPLLQQPSLSTVSRTSRPRSPRNFLFSVGGGPYGSTHVPKYVARRARSRLLGHVTRTRAPPRPTPAPSSPAGRSRSRDPASRDVLVHGARVARRPREGGATPRRAPETCRIGFASWLRAPPRRRRGRALPHAGD